MALSGGGKKYGKNKEKIVKIRGAHGLKELVEAIPSVYNMYTFRRIRAAGERKGCEIGRGAGRRRKRPGRPCADRRAYFRTKPFASPRRVPRGEPGTRPGAFPNRPPSRVSRDGGGALAARPKGKTGSWNWSGMEL